MTVLATHQLKIKRKNNLQMTNNKNNRPMVGWDFLSPP